MKYLLIILGLFLSSQVFAHDYEQPHAPSSISIQGNPTSLNIAISQASLGDWSTQKWQASVGLGSYDGSNSLAVGIAKKSCQDCLLFHGVVGTSENKTAMGVGMSFRF